MTVAGGMGLSFVHGSVFSNPTPVRAQVIGPAPIVSRATVVRAEPVLQEKPTQVAVATGEVVLPEIEYAVIDPEAPKLSLLGADEFLEEGTPTVSLRPAIRPETQPTEARTARLTVTPKRQEPFLRSQPDVQRTAPRPIAAAPARRVAPPPQRTASRSLPPTVLIGVYR